MVKKVIFKGLNRGTFRFVSLGGVRFYDAYGDMVSFVTPSLETIHTAILDNATISVEGSFSAFYGPFKAFDTSVPQTGNSEVRNVWMSRSEPSEALDVTVEFTNPQLISKIEFVPLPDGSDGGVVEEFSIEAYDNNLDLIVAYNVTPISTRDIVQTLITDELYFTMKTLFYSNGEYKRYEHGGFSENVIPIMTSNTQPSGIASASSVRFTRSAAFRAFSQHAPTVSEDSWTSNTVPPVWLEYDFGNDNRKTIRGYVLYNSVEPEVDEMPKDWIFQASNDGLSWVDLDTRGGEINWQSSEGRGYLFENNEAYSKYRIYILDNNRVTSRQWTSINLLQMFEGIRERRWHTVSTTLPTAQMFKEEGMNGYTSLDRQIQNVLDSPIQMAEEGLLGEGKIFKGKVDLKKIIDLRNLKVE